MKELMTIFGVIFPIFFTIILGYILKRTGVLKKQFLDEGNNLIFNLFMPLYMFIGIYKSSDLSNLNINIFYLVLVIEFILFFFGMYILNKMELDDEERPTILQSFIRPNLLIYGIALAQSFYGKGTDIGNLILTLAFLAPITNVFSVLAFEVYKNKEGKINYKNLLLGIVKNRLIQAAILSIFFKISGIKLPNAVISPLTDLSNITTPLGLLFIGANLKLEYDKRMTKCINIAVIARNFLIPLVGLTISCLLGFRGMDLFAILITLSAPVAISSFVMTVNYTSKGLLASNIIMATTLLSSVTMLVALYVLSVLRYI